MKNRFVRTLSLLICGMAAALGAGESYNFTFFSDTHFADPETYSHDPNDRFHFPDGKKDPLRPQKAMPVYRAMFDRMAKSFDKETKFAICAGDMIDGFAKSPELHAGEVQKAVDFLTRAIPRPVYIINGNHDTHSRGGVEAYHRVMLPYLEKLTGEKLTATDYTVRIGDDLFIFADYFGHRGKERMAFVLETLQKLTWKPRYVFVVIHGPILPKGSPLHDRVLTELGKFNGFILCGHKHKMLLLECKTPDGVVTQFGATTLLQPVEARNRLFPPVTGDAALGKETVTVTFPMTRIWFCRGQGYAHIFVSDAGVEAVIHSAAADSPTQTVKLR